MIVFVCDIRTGMTAADQEVAGMLQRSRKPVVLAVNKMDSTGHTNPDIYEFYNLGLGDPRTENFSTRSSTLDFFRIPAVSMMRYFCPSFSK